MEEEIKSLEHSFEKTKNAVQTLIRKLNKIVEKNARMVNILKNCDSIALASNAETIRILSQLQILNRQRITQITLDNDIFYAEQLNRISTKLYNNNENNNNSVEYSSRAVESNSKWDISESDCTDNDVQTMDNLCQTLSRTKIAFKVSTRKGKTCPVKPQKKFEDSTSEDEINSRPRNNKRYFAQNSNRPFNFMIEKEPKKTTTGIPLSFKILEKPIISGNNNVPFELKLNDVCIISSYKGPECFYINIVNDMLFTTLQRLTQNLNNYATTTNRFNSKAEAVNTLTLSKKCIAFSEKHKNWYRADIIDWLQHSNTEISIQFMDIGGIEYINYSMLRILRPSDLTYNNFAIKCFLAKNVSSITNNWSKDQQEAFDNYVSNVPTIYYKIKYSCKIQDCLAVDLVNLKFDESEETETLADIVLNCRHSHINLPEKITAAPVVKLRRPKELPQKVLKSALLPAKGEVVKLFVTNFEAVNVFYAHVKSNIIPTPEVTPLKQLGQDINSGKKYINFEYPPKVGTVVLAKSLLNYRLFRGVIEDVLRRRNGSYAINVFFVDYGQTETLQLNEIYQIPDEYLCLPKQIVRCTIGNILPLDHFDIHRIRENMDSIYLGSTFTAEILETGPDFIEAKVFFQDLDVGIDLIQKGMAKLK